MGVEDAVVRCQARVRVGFALASYADTSNRGPAGANSECWQQCRTSQAMQLALRRRLRRTGLRPEGILRGPRPAREQGCWPAARKSSSAHGVRVARARRASRPRDSPGYRWSRMRGASKMIYQRLRETGCIQCLGFRGVGF